MLQEKTRLSVSCPGDPNSSTIARCAISKPNNKFPIFQDQRKARPEQFRADGNRSSTQRMTVGGTQPRKESVVEGRWPRSFRQHGYGYLVPATSRVYVMLGDGEMAEGQVWEAAAFAGHYKLENLTVFGRCERAGSKVRTCSLSPLLCACRISSTIMSRIAALARSRA